MSIESFLAEYGNTLILFIIFQLILSLISGGFRKMRSKNWTKPAVMLGSLAIAWIMWTTDIFALGWWNPIAAAGIIVTGVILVAKT